MVKQVYKRAIYILIGTIFLSIVVYCVDNCRKIPQNKKGESILKRESQGKGSREEELIIEFDGKHSAIDVEIKEQQYSKEEIQEVFEQAKKEIEQLILGKNESLEEVRSNLNLIKVMPDSGIEVSWELDSYDVLQITGELRTENLQEEGTLVKLKALFTYGQEKAEHQFYAHVYPPKIIDSEQLLQSVKRQLQQADSETKEGEYLALPTQLDGKKISWHYKKDMRAFGLFFLGVVLAGLTVALEKQKQINEKKEREVQLSRDYPQVISTFNLYLGAGIPVRKAWFQMAITAQGANQGRYVYEEMAYTMYEMQNGASEKECYEHFGKRCQVASYRKLGMLLSQNLRKGTKGLSQILKKEAAIAFEERKGIAKRLGEEAGTKLLGPMFLMLGIVLIIIIVPAFFSIQI